MLDLERQKSNSLQAEVLRRGAEHLQVGKMRLVSYKLAANDYGVILSPHTQHTRDEAHYSSEREWMHMEEKQPESAAAGSGGYEY